MKLIFQFFFQLLLFSQFVTAQSGFSSIIPLTPIPLSQPTKDKPQAKVWSYANRWWCVLSTETGTKIFRLDGTIWTSILTLDNRSCKPDCLVEGNLVHILVYRGGATTSFIYTIEYNPLFNTYHLWSLRPNSSTLTFAFGSETAMLIVDSKRRMWAGSAGTSEVDVWWSDPPYSTWSNPIVLATGLKVDDICALTTIPLQNKIGIFWSNQNSKRFGFRTHTDGASPEIWSADEMPAAQYAVDNIGDGMADDHMNFKAASDGTLYCVSKTGYNKTGYPKIILLIRRPSGNWDKLYPVTMNLGSQSLLLLNEVQGKIKIIYTSEENGGDILYKESSTAKISFGPAMTLLSDPGKMYNYATSTHQNHNSEVVIIITDVTSNPQKAISMLASDGKAFSQNSPIIPIIRPAMPLILDTSVPGPHIRAYPNPFSSNTKVSFKLEHSGIYSILVYDTKGIEVLKFAGAWGEAGKEYELIFNGASLPAGIYYLSLKVGNKNYTSKLLLTGM